MSETGEWKTERWVYLGRRLGKGNVLRHWFLTEREDVDVVVFAKVMVHPIIGATYLVDTKGELAKIQHAELVKGDHRRKIDDSDVNKWRAQDQEASIHKRALSARSRMASNNNDIGGLTLREVHRLMGNAGPSQRAGFVAAVLEYLR